MLLFWRIRYFDSRDRQFKDRDSWLETDKLDPATRAAVELCYQLPDSSHQRRWLNFRHLFCTEKTTSEAWTARCEQLISGGSVFIRDYFEDEDGNELQPKRLAELVTGSPNAILLPSGARQHDVDFMLAGKRPLSLDQLSIAADDLKILGYFTRDLREILVSAFFKDGPGSLKSLGNSDPVLQTAVSDEEIRSFVTIFRRLYMTNEPAGFRKAVEVFTRLAQGNPLGTWISSTGNEYERELGEPPSMVPYIGRGNLSITRKRLIDVYLYTQYAHQPDEKRFKQYNECLAAVGGRHGLLAWLFLTTMWESCLHMRNAGVIIADCFDRYCAVHGITPDVLTSISRDNPGIGQLEKKDDCKQRLLEESVLRLSQQLWEDGGKPPGGPAIFMAEAHRALMLATGSAQV